MWRRVGSLGPGGGCRSLLYEATRSDCNAFLRTQSISSISDYLIFPGLAGPSGIRNQFDSFLIPARQTLAHQEIRVCDAPRKGMESTHRAHDRPLISHNSSDAAAWADRGSRGRTRGLGSCFICRGIWSDDFFNSAPTLCFSISELRGSLRTPIPQAPSPLCLPIRWNVSSRYFGLLHLSHQVQPRGSLRHRALGGWNFPWALAPHRQLIICTDR